MSAPWFKFYQNDWLASQSEMTSDEQLVFLTAIVMMYANDGPIVEDAERIALRVRRPIRKVEQALRRLRELEKLKLVAENRLTNKKVEEVIRHRQAAAETASAKGKAAAAAKWSKQSKNQDLTNARGIAEAPPSSATTMQNQNQREKEKENLSLETAYKESLSFQEPGKTPFPADFELTPNRRLEAMRLGVPTSEIAGAFEHFMDFHKRDAIHRADWDAAWRYWCKRRAQLPKKKETDPRLY